MPLRKALVGIACLAVVGGLLGWLAASQGWVVLLPHVRDRLAACGPVTYLAVMWAHLAAYLGLLLATIGLARHARRVRRALSP